MTNAQTNARKTVNATEFAKRVEIEYAYLTYMDRMPEMQARQKARETVSQEYVVE